MDRWLRESTWEEPYNNLGSFSLNSARPIFSSRRAGGKNEVGKEVKQAGASAGDGVDGGKDRDGRK